MIFELLFLFCVLISLISLVAAFALAVCARRSAAKRLLMFLGIGWALYLSVVFLVSALTPQRIIPMNQDLCLDEMCFAVVKVQTSSQLGPGNRQTRANGIFHIVTVRVTSQARRRVQREGGLRALLWSPDGEYQISPAGQRAWEEVHAETRALTTRLAPGESVFSDQVFDVPPQATNLSLVLSHGLTPGYFVIGECPLFHKPTILRLPL